MNKIFMNAVWITPDKNIGSASPVITKRFNIEKKTPGAALYITGLGFFEARLNGKKLGNEYFQPVASDYGKRNLETLTYPCHDSFTHRIYYNRYDISEYLNEGGNTLEVQPGGGWYVQTERIAEETKDGELDFGSTGAHYTCSSGKKQIMTDTFVCDGERRVFEPKFVWHAFRYFDVEGEIESCEVLVIHSDVSVTSTFGSDSEGMNFLYDAYVRTELDNMHGSFPSDCPHRERLGYTGDGQVTAQAAMLTLGSKEFYRKWIRDILDCQDKNSGHVQHTAPFMGGGGGPGGWGSAIVVVPYRYWKNFGDTDILRECLPAIGKWIDYLVSRSENHLVVREEEGGWCLGDWCTLEKCEIPEPLVNT